MQRNRAATSHAVNANAHARTRALHTECFACVVDETDAAATTERIEAAIIAETK